MFKMSLVTIAQMAEEEIRAYFERVRWRDGHACPHCGVVDSSYRLNGKSHRVGLWKCRDCGRQHRVEVGTVMHGSRIGLRRWLMAFYLMASSKKGVSALQLQRQLGIGSYKTAWHLCHRVRTAMKNSGLDKIGGDNKVVEADEVHLGGKDKWRHKRDKGTKKKTPVLALVERGGKVKAMPVERIDGDTLRPLVKEHVAKGSALHTDGHKAYVGLGAHFSGGHHTVDHGGGEYARGGVHSQTVECFFALFRRGVAGSFHSISRRHLSKYLDEFAFRFGLNKDSDEHRTETAVKQCSGVRLPYHTLKKDRKAA